ncbi:thermonuclease family protein [Paracoccus sp. (in: a-proteobacteria)]|uniref:thermonuclease family protein n=1 Tax=Paracoccus sp. TaxID=267 RepID=UPI0026E0D345|nr:thermonuclease family protein [Paracoccus sp. (in: a-proteobacteria)]MDO5648050.1 thermonuclease family protein [Paracoccus sp. (in: a-proteobacteria)]
MTHSAALDAFLSFAVLVALAAIAFHAITRRVGTTGAKALRGPAWVTDGDTIVIRGRQVRLFGIDAPELHHPYGQNAKGALIRLCNGQIIHAEIMTQDVHGRIVARCRLPDGRDLSAEMVKLGLAIDWPKFSGHEYRQFEVQDVRKKLWLADARQRGRMDVWQRYEARRDDR